MTTTPPKPLTQEELTKLEESNGLLQYFGHWFEGLQNLPEFQDVKLDGAIMFLAFYTGCAAVARIQQHTTTKVAIEMSELQRVIATMSNGGPINETK